MFKIPYHTPLRTGLLLAGLLSIAVTVSAQSQVEAVGLFKGAALLKVDGEQKLVKAGQSFKGVLLREASSREAVVEVNGEAQVLTVSRRISTNFKQRKQATVRIPTNEHRQYITNAQINGRGTTVLVDTGANIVALNSTTAKSLGIDFLNGTPGRVTTASGAVTAWRVMLDHVVVGGIRVNHVQASVLEGAHPETVLLGMSYLQHVDLQEKDGILMLTRKF